MLWGCHIDKYHPCQIHSTEDCILTIQNIYLNLNQTQKKFPNYKIYLHLKHNENDVILSILRTFAKENTIVNIPLNINKDNKVELYIQGGNFSEDISIDLLGNIKTIKKQKTNIK
jgi:hypothetical protein